MYGNVNCHSLQATMQAQKKARPSFMRLHSAEFSPDPLRHWHKQHIVKGFLDLHSLLAGRADSPVQSPAAQLPWQHPEVPSSLTVMGALDCAFFTSKLPAGTTLLVKNEHPILIHHRPPVPFVITGGSSMASSCRYKLMGGRPEFHNATL